MARCSQPMGKKATTSTTVGPGGDSSWAPCRFVPTRLHRSTRFYEQGGVYLQAVSRCPQRPREETPPPHWYKFCFTLSRHDRDRVADPDRGHSFPGSHPARWHARGSRMERYEVYRIAEHLRCQLAGRVHELRLLLRDNGLVLQGHSRSYHAKQLARYFVMEATHLPLLVNDIKVLRRSEPDSDREP
jgi:hypothetical protein